MGQWGKAKCLGENPSNCQLPFLSFSPIIYFWQNVVELVIAWNGKSMGNQIRVGQRPIFENRVLTSLARKMPKNVGHSAMHPRFSVSSRFGNSWSFSCVFSFHVFCCWLHFSHGLEVIFVMSGLGLPSSHFWSCWCVLHSRFCDFMCFLPWL